VKEANQLEAVIPHTVDRHKMLVAQRVTSECFEAAGATVIVDFSILCRLFQH
jgi:hypothetical protein